jgi:hypothetical protein
VEIPRKRDISDKGRLGIQVDLCDRLRGVYYKHCPLGHHNVVTPRFKGQSRVHLIHAPKKTTYIITECIEINVTITSEYLLHCGSLTK